MVKTQNAQSERILNCSKKWSPSGHFVAVNLTRILYEVDSHGRQVGQSVHDEIFVEAIQHG